MFLTKLQADSLKNTIDSAYHRRDDYPPYAVMSWDDRTRYRAYIFKLIDEMTNG